MDMRGRVSSQHEAPHRVLTKKRSQVAPFASAACWPITATQYFGADLVTRRMSQAIYWKLASLTTRCAGRGWKRLVLRGRQRARLEEQVSHCSDSEDAAKRVDIGRDLGTG